MSFRASLLLCRRLTPYAIDRRDESGQSSSWRPSTVSLGAVSVDPSSGLSSTTSSPRPRPSASPRNSHTDGIGSKMSCLSASCCVRSATRGRQRESGKRTTNAGRLGSTLADVAAQAARSSKARTAVRDTPFAAQAARPPSAHTLERTTINSAQAARLPRSRAVPTSDESSVLVGRSRHPIRFES